VTHPADDHEFSHTCAAVVRDSRRITAPSTDEVRQIVLHVDDPAFRYVEGQNIGVLVPGPHDFGNEYHHRYYSIANARTAGDDAGLDIELLVRRCFYIDEVSGERYPGVASNYLCDAKPGQKITLTGPYRSPFRIPDDADSNLLMIGTGTGIAPFRAFMQRIYRERPGWRGQVRLFYGARSGMDLLYMNDVDDDLTNYYDEATFKAFQAVCRRPLSAESEALEQTLDENVEEAWRLITDPKTHVYLAGLRKNAAALDRVMANAAGSLEAWQKVKERLQQEGRWSELVYH